MIDYSRIRQIDRNAPGSFAELRKLQRCLSGGNLDEVADALTKYGVDIDQLALSELEQVVRHIIGEPNPLSETSAA